MAKNDGGPAFPQEKVYVAPDQQMMSVGPRGGMTLRDYFAAAVLPSCYAQVCSYCAERGWPEDWRSGLASDAYKIADAMLAERDK